MTADMIGALAHETVEWVKDLAANNGDINDAAFLLDGWSLGVIAENLRYLARLSRWCGRDRELPMPNMDALTDDDLRTIKARAESMLAGGC